MPSPDLRFYADPLDGFLKQIAELRGLVRIVPPLVDADRKRRWDEIGQRPGNPDVEMIDVFETEAGEDEGFGHADYSRAIYSSAIVTGWEIFRDYLAYELLQRFLNFDVASHVAIEASVTGEKAKCEQNFEHLTRRYKEWADVNLAKHELWGSLQHIRKLRNILVHGFGVYTEQYLRDPNAIRPSKEELYGFGDPENDGWLAGREQVPMREADVLQMLADLKRSAIETRALLDSSSKSQE